jgi:SAM-dependent methyltransferase
MRLKVTGLTRRVRRHSSSVDIAGTGCYRGTMHKVVEAWLGLLRARTLMTATQLRVFDAIGDDEVDALEVATRCGTNPAATRSLLRALAATEFLTSENERYRLNESSRALVSGRGSLRDKVLFMELEEEWWDGCEQFVRSGVPIDIHGNLDDRRWNIYQRGMRAGKDDGADEVAEILALRDDARTALDIGGGHGAYAVALCRRYPRLQATILDLPAAIEQAAPLLAVEGLGERVRHRAGDARTADLGQPDVVLMASLVHHFDDATNRALVARIARALRPGGKLAIIEVIRGSGPAGGLLDLYFAMTSKSGTWTMEEISSWYEDAGLNVCARARLRTFGSVGVVVGVRE